MLLPCTCFHVLAVLKLLLLLPTLLLLQGSYHTVTARSKGIIELVPSLSLSAAVCYCCCCCCCCRGPVIGSLKALLGLGPSLFAAVYHMLLAPDAASLLLLLALAPAVIVGLGSGAGFSQNYCHLRIDSCHLPNAGNAHGSARVMEVYCLYMRLLQLSG
jgi:hypothetical protein